MAYVTKDLNDDEDRAQGQSELPSLWDTPTASSGPMKPQGTTNAVGSQQTAQQQHGTGFTNLSQWLDAGKGRDQGITNQGAKSLGVEKDKFGAATTTANAGLEASKPINLQGDTGAALDRAAGIIPGVSPQRSAALAPTPPPAPAQPFQPATLQHGVGAIGGAGPKLISRPSAPAPSTPTAIGLNPVGGGTAPVEGPMPTSQVRDGPTIDQVLNQKYDGPGAIDYQAGDDFQDATMLGETSTVSDVLGRDSINKGQYSQGMRSLDNLLYGADRASQDAIGTNKTNTDTFKKDAIATGDDFTKRAGERSGEIDDAAGRLRTELTAIGDNTKTSLAARAAAANAQAQERSNSTDMVLDPATGKMVPLRAGDVMGGWEGDAVGSANAGNVMTAAEEKRFGALNKYLGYDGVTRTGQYNEGRRTVEKGEAPTIAPGFTDEQLNEARDLMVKESDMKQQNGAMTAAGIIGTIFGAGLPAASMLGVGLGNGMQMEKLKSKYSPSQWEEIVKAVKKRWGVDLNGNVNAPSGTPGPYGTVR